ncbi:MAG: arylsulfatase, partial [Hyphomonas sp.]|nr:arylsulfatase [Hyphomonas sp.]
VIKGDYKLTRNQLPHGDGRWRLYDLSKDPGETTDLSASYPEIYDDLSREYADYGARVGVLEVPEGYNSIDEVTRHSIARQQERYRPYLIGGGLALFVIIAGGILLWRRRKQGA